MAFLGPFIYSRFFIWPVFFPQAFLMASLFRPFIIFIIDFSFIQCFPPPGFSRGQCFFPGFSSWPVCSGPLFFYRFFRLFSWSVFRPFICLDFSGFSHGKFFTPRILFRFFICPVFFPQAFLMTTNFSGPLFFV